MQEKESALWSARDWPGPYAETRPELASDEWPNSSIERVIFTEDEFPEYASRHPGILPYVLYFDEDGWPSMCPSEVRLQLDPRMKLEFHRFPWTAARHSEWKKDVRHWREFAGSYEKYIWCNSQWCMPYGLPECPSNPSHIRRKKVRFQFDLLIDEETLKRIDLERIANFELNIYPEKKYTLCVASIDVGVVYLKVE